MDSAETMSNLSQGDTCFIQIYNSSRFEIVYLVYINNLGIFCNSRRRRFFNDLPSDKIKNKYCIQISTFYQYDLWAKNFVFQK